MKKSMEHCRIDTDRGNQKYTEVNIFQCQFVNHWSQIDWPGIEPGPTWWEVPPAVFTQNCLLPKRISRREHLITHHAMVRHNMLALLYGLFHRQEGIYRDSAERMRRVADCWTTSTWISGCLRVITRVMSYSPFVTDSFLQECHLFAVWFCFVFEVHYYYYYYYYYYYVSCHRPILPGNSIEPTVIPTAQASSFTLQYFPYYVWCSKYSCLL
jgi:hypothetical protein